MVRSNVSLSYPQQGLLFFLFFFSLRIEAPAPGFGKMIDVVEEW